MLCKDYFNFSFNIKNEPASPVEKRVFNMANASIY